jgi:hypothetical protein
MPNRKSLIYTVCILLLASLPSLWVIKNRWLDPFPGRRLIRRVFGWCSWQLFCQSTLPAIVIVAFLLCAAALAAVLFQARKNQVSPPIFTPPDAPATPAADQPRKRSPLISRILWGISAAGLLLTAAHSLISGRIPGWDLIAVFTCFLAGFLLRENTPFADWIRRNCGFAAALFLNHLSFIAGLYAWSDHRQWTAAAAAAFLATLGLLLLRYRRRLPPVYFVFLLALLLFTLGNNTWWSSLVGDEYSQFDLDYALIRSRDWIWFGGNLFNVKGNFGTTPMLASYIQVFFMKVLGADGFGWRFSNAYLCAAGIVLLHSFLRKFVAGRAALAAAALLACSSYLIDFAKIGYTNLQAFFAAALVLALADRAARTVSKTAFCLLGAGMAFCCYTFPAALYALPLPVLFLCFYYPPKSREAVWNWGILIAALGMLSFPLFLQPEYWIDKVPGTLLVTPQAVESAGAAANHVLSNLFYAFFSFLYVQQETHFVAASYADPLTGVFVLIGFCVFLFRIRKSRFAAFWMTAFLALLLAAGASHGYSFPPTTRMFLMLPWWMAFAAAGLEYLLAQFSAWLHPSPGALFGAWGGILLAAIGLNVYQAQGLAYELYGSRPPLESIFLRQAMEADRIHPVGPRQYVFLTDTSWTAEGLADLLRVYPEYLKGAGISSAKVDGGRLPQAVSEALEEPGTIVFLLPFLNPDWQASMEADLSDAGFAPCRIRTPEGEEVVAVFASPEYSSTCHARWGFPPGADSASWEALFPVRRSGGGCPYSQTPSCTPAPVE